MDTNKNNKLFIINGLGVHFLLDKTMVVWYYCIMRVKERQKETKGAKMGKPKIRIKPERVSVLKTNSGYCVIRQGRGKNEAVILGNNVKSITAVYALINRDSTRFVERNPGIGLASFITWKFELTEAEMEQINERGKSWETLK